MLEGVLFQYSTGYYGGVIGNLVAQWNQMGFFSYVLPFLLIFAIVFGVLSKVKSFQDNKGVNAIIAVVVGLIAVNTDFVPRFFSEIFPQLGVGLAILLVAVILLEFFLVNNGSENTWTKYVYFAIGAIIFLVILFNMSDDFGWGYYWWSEYWAVILGLAFIIGIIAIVMKDSNKDAEKKAQDKLLKQLGKGSG